MAEEKKHYMNKQVERHHEKAFGGKETEGEERSEGSHQSFHVYSHPVHGIHSVHHHAGGIDHAEHGSHEEAMEHGKQVMGMQEPPGEGGQMPAGSEDGWGAEE